MFLASHSKWATFIIRTIFRDFFQHETSSSHVPFRFWSQIVFHPPSKYSATNIPDFAFLPSGSTPNCGCSKVRRNVTKHSRCCTQIRYFHADCDFDCSWLIAVITDSKFPIQNIGHVHPRVLGVCTIPQGITKWYVQCSYCRHFALRARLWGNYYYAALRKKVAMENDWLSQNKKVTHF